MVNVRIHVHFYAGFDDVFWSCNAGFCSPTPSVSSPPILPPLAEQKPSLHRQNTLFTKDHSYKNFQPLSGAAMCGCASPAGGTPPSHYFLTYIACTIVHKSVCTYIVYCTESQLWQLWPPSCEAEVVSALSPLISTQETWPPWALKSHLATPLWTPWLPKERLNTRQE